MKIIEFENVCFRYLKQGPDVLRGISFSVEPGELALIRGVSGGGKTTTLYLAGGLLRPTGGRILYEDKPIGIGQSALSRYRRDNVGFILQKYVLINEKTALENVMLPLSGLRPAKEAKKLAMDSLSSLGIEELSARYPSELSSGQQQRVAFARAIVARPRLLLADEPTAALDPGNSRMILDMLRVYAAHGNAVLVCTHEEVLRGGEATLWRLEGGSLIKE